MKRSQPKRKNRTSTRMAQKRDDRKQKAEEEEDDKAESEEEGQTKEEEDEEDFTQDREEGVLDRVKSDGPQQTDDGKGEDEKSRRRKTKHARKISEIKPGASNESRSRGGSDEDVGMRKALRSRNTREDDKKSSKIGPKVSDEHMDVKKSCKPIKRKFDGGDENDDRLADKTQHKQVRDARREGVADKKLCVRQKLVFDAGDEHMADNKPYQQDARDKRTADRRMSDNRSCKQDKPVCDARGVDIAGNREEQGSEGEENGQGSGEDGDENRKDSDEDEDAEEDAGGHLRKGDDDSEGGSDEQGRTEEEEEADDHMGKENDEEGSEGGSDEQERSEEEEEADDHIGKENDEEGSEGGSDEQERSEEEEAGDHMGKGDDEEDSEGSQQRSEEEEDCSVQNDDDEGGGVEDRRDHNEDADKEEEFEEDSSVVEHSSEKDNDGKDDASLETAAQYIRLIHKYDEGVLQLLVEMTQLCPNTEIKCCDLFAEYYKREADPHRISDPSPYELWHRAVRAATQQAARTADTVLSQLRQLAEDVQVQCARKYVPGILDHKDQPMAVSALRDLGQKIPSKRDEFEAMQALFPVQMNENPSRILVTADMPPPIEILRNLYAKNKSYEAVKEDFEKANVYVINQDEFLALADNKNVGPNQQFKMPYKIANQKSLSKRWNHWQYNELNDHNEIVSQPFFVRWEQDPTRQMYNTTCVDPECKQTDTDSKVYNLYPGLQARRLRPISEQDVVLYSKPFFDHLLHVTANGSDENFHFLKYRLAKIVQEQWMKSNEMICLYGPDGAREDIIFKFFGERVLGNACFIQTNDPENGLIAKCPQIMRGKLLVLLGDIDLSRKSERTLKDLITGSDISCPNNRGSNIAHIENYANFICSTNEPPHFKFPGMESCVVRLKVSAARSGDTSYYNMLDQSLKHPKAAVAVYQILRDVDLMSIKFSQQPFRAATTESLETQMLEAVTTFEDFMSVVANSRIAGVENKKVVFKIRSKELYECSMQCCSLRYKNKPMPFKIFGSHLQELLETYKSPNTANTNYVVSQAQICEELKKLAKYSEVARLPEGEILQLQVKPR